MLTIKRGLALAMSMVLLIGAGGCRREDVATQKEPMTSGDIMAGEIPYPEGLEELKELTAPLGEETESAAESNYDEKPGLSQSAVSGTVELDSVLSAVVPDVLEEPTNQPDVSVPETTSDTPAHRPVEGRLMDLLQDHPSSNGVIDWYGLSLLMKRQNFLVHIISMDFSNPIYYTAVTGENQYYAVHRTEEGGLHFLFFKPVSVETACALSDGVWTPLNFLMRKGRKSDGELGRWVNGVWQKWDKPVEEEIQNASPNDTVATLLNDEIYKGTWEKKTVYDARLSHAVYVKEIHSSKDFASIQKGSSPQEVIEIDSSAEKRIDFLSDVDRFYTLHMLTDGMLCIVYEYDEAFGGQRVSQLLYYPDYRVNLGEVFGIESDEICDFSILPEDRFW